MACRWELLLGGRPTPSLRAAGESALAEIDRTERQLSAFLPSSPVSAINRGAAARPVRVDPTLLGLLERCGELVARTGGRFDPTVGPLLRLWGLRGAVDRPPDDDQIAEVLARVGWHRVSLDAATGTVRFTVPGMALDFGAVGKGLAADRAIAVLRDEGVESALLHGGTSTVAALGDEVRRIALPGGEAIGLRAGALSVSSPAGRTATVGDRTVGHVIDPVTGRPTSAVALAAAAGPEGLVAEALSTALVAGFPDAAAGLADRFGDYGLLVQPARGATRRHRWPAG